MLNSCAMNTTRKTLLLGFVPVMPLAIILLIQTRLPTRVHKLKNGPRPYLAKTSYGETNVSFFIGTPVERILEKVISKNGLSFFGLHLQRPVPILFQINSPTNLLVMVCQSGTYQPSSNSIHQVKKNYRVRVIDSFGNDLGSPANLGHTGGSERFSLSAYSVKVSPQRGKIVAVRLYQFEDTTNYTQVAEFKMENPTFR